MTLAHGRLVADELGYDGGRGVTAYLPEHPDAVVFAADGAAVAEYAAALEAAGIDTVALVGAHALPDEGARLAEYTPVFDAARFAAHEAFFVHDVAAWARTRLGLDLPPDRTAVFGASAGGELALALGLAHPDGYAAILSGSPGAGFRPDGDLPATLPRTYLLAGRQEPFFRENAERWSAALEAAGAEVVLDVRDGEHGSALWEPALPDMVAWAFGLERRPE